MKQQDASAGGRGIEGELLESHKCILGCNRSAITFNGFCCQCFPRSAPNLNKTKEEEKDNDESGHGNKLLALTSSAIVTFVNETGGAARSDAERCAQKTLEWVEDTDASICADCGATIQASTMMGVTLKTNKHHCRRCGQVFCGACTSHRLIISTLSASPVRVCNSCYDRTLLERTVTPEDIDLLVTGKVLLKHGRRSWWPRKKRVRLEADLSSLVYHKEREEEPQQQNMFPLKEIQAVVSGLNTQVFKRSGLKKHKEDKCFSIIMRDRTLDFEALTVSECNEWAMALSKLIVLSAYKSPEEHRRHIN